MKMPRQQFTTQFTTTFFDVFRLCKSSEINLMPLLINKMLFIYLKKCRFKNKFYITFLKA